MHSTLIMVEIVILKEPMKSVTLLANRRTYFPACISYKRYRKYTGPSIFVVVLEVLYSFRYEAFK